MNKELAALTNANVSTEMSQNTSDYIKSDMLSCRGIQCEPIYISSPEDASVINRQSMSHGSWLRTIKTLQKMSHDPWHLYRVKNCALCTDQLLSHFANALFELFPDEMWEFSLAHKWTITATLTPTALIFGVYRICANCAIKIQKRKSKLTHWCTLIIHWYRQPERQNDWTI